METELSMSIEETLKLLNKASPTVKTKVLATAARDLALILVIAGGPRKSSKDAMECLSDIIVPLIRYEIDRVWHILVDEAQSTD